MWQRFIGNQLTEAVIRICQTFDRIIGQTDKLLPFINQQKTNVHILVSRNRPFSYIGHSMAIIKVRLFNVYICLVCSFARNQFHFIISKKVTVANFFFFLRKVKCSEPLFFCFDEPSVEIRYWLMSVEFSIFIMFTLLPTV